MAPSTEKYRNLVDFEFCISSSPATKSSIFNAAFVGVQWVLLATWTMKDND